MAELDVEPVLWLSYKWSLCCSPATVPGPAEAQA